MGKISEDRAFRSARARMGVDWTDEWDGMYFTAVIHYY